MSTLNGIGTRFNAVSQPDEQGNVHATHWFTFLYLPLVPRWRAEIKREVTLPLKTFNYQIIQKLPLDRNEILKTYFYGWILIPLLFIGPILFLIPGIHQQFGIASPPPRNLIKGDPLNWHDWFFISYIVYLIVLSINLYSNDIKRGLPKDYKTKLRK
jgi:hypothetical protein